MTRSRLLKFSKLSQRELRLNMNYLSSISEVTMVQNSKTLISKNFLMNMALHMNPQLLIHRNKMVWSRERIEHLLKWPEQCLLNTRLLSGSGPKQLTLHVIIDKVYLHKFLKKTSHELITGKKPNVSYLRVFGAPCYIRDMNHSSKFAPKAHEGFLLGYGSNSHTYRVYNSHLGKVVETVNVRFDETNGSQKEQLPHDPDEPPIDEVIRSMAIGEILPVEVVARQANQD